jgi:hypothetical protein
MGDSKTGAFAAVHAGWRGTLAEIAVVAVTRLADEYEVRPYDIASGELSQRLDLVVMKLARMLLRHSPASLPMERVCLRRRDPGTH